jgi:hypothetical protein
VVTRRIAALCVAACALTLAGCGSDSDSNASNPDVRSRVVSAKTLLGFPLLPEAGNAVRTDPGVWVADSPFPLYADPEQATADLRRGTFIAGIIKIFKAAEGVGSAGNIVVQMGDGKAASDEVARQAAQAVALPCPDACRKHSERFAVPGVPDARGVDLTSTFDRPVTEAGMTFKVTHDISIFFTKGAFAYQLFAGGPSMERRRDELIAAAQAQYKRVP